MVLWLGAVLLGTGIAGVARPAAGRRAGALHHPIHRGQPNPLYRRVCYTFAWSAAITFAVLNIAGLVVAIVTGQWYLKQIYATAYFPIAGTIWLLGAAGTAAAGEAVDQRRRSRAAIFLRHGLGDVHRAAGVVADVVRRCRKRARATALKLAIFLGILAFVGNLARLGRLPRTRPIVPGELAVSD